MSRKWKVSPIDGMCWYGGSPGEANGGNSAPASYRWRKDALCLVSGCDKRSEPSHCYCGPHGLERGHGVTPGLDPKQGGTRLIEGVPVVFPGDGRQSEKQAAIWAARSKRRAASHRQEGNGA